MGIFKKKRYSYTGRVTASHNYCSRSPKKRGRKAVKLSAYLIILFLIVFFAYKGCGKVVDYAYGSESISVKDIEIVGGKNVTKTEIKELLPFDVGDNLLKINLSDAEDEIKKIKPELKDITISRRWKKVRVRLYERTPEAFVYSGRELAGVDFDDKPFPLRGFMSGMKVPKIICKDSQERARLLGFLKAFKPVCRDFLDTIDEVKFSNTDDIILVTRDGTLIFWGDDRADRLKYRFDKFQKIYADAVLKHKKIEYINMALYDFGRAVIKPKI
ncbi:cell division protein FtsQ/DivIB [Endomicrobium proavitum]|uniref:Putative cell division protein FtsQ n=1 Tax=Endomicrobium proavitum TaxID=1408281 RepID=A0A0G3WJ02_9BACT|nr:FtsQ-type POTRA domain-containing protein [Endomicrobium proavitum]AKL98303.1 putative cell division protein FtsQ [Endomicrobium proavitum]